MAFPAFSASVVIEAEALVSDIKYLCDFEEEITPKKLESALFDVESYVKEVLHARVYKL